MHVCSPQKFHVYLPGFLTDKSVRDCVCIHIIQKSKCLYVMYLCMMVLSLYEILERLACQVRVWFFCTCLKWIALSS